MFLVMSLIYMVGMPRLLMKLITPGGKKALIAENLALKQQEVQRLKKELDEKKQMRELLAGARAAIKKREFVNAKTVWIA